jgi:hypothetical protein
MAYSKKERKEHKEGGQKRSDKVLVKKYEDKESKKRGVLKKQAREFGRKGDREGALLIGAMSQEPIKRKTAAEIRKEQSKKNLKIKKK